MTPRRLLAIAAGLAVWAVGCTGGEPPAPAPAPPARTGDVRSTDALAGELCRRPAPPEIEPGGATTDLPPAIDEVVRQVQEVRGLEFLEPVRAEAVTHAELVGRLEQYLDYSYAESILGPRTLAWRAMGVIPPDADIRESLIEFAGGQIIGFYDPDGGQLVFIGTEDPTPLERLTLAHELTHALDDQHFALERLNDLEAECRDEELLAALGVVEGSAQYFAAQWAQTYLTAEEIAEVALGGGGELPQGVPELITQLQYWPYLEGLSFVTARTLEGGVDAVNEALERLPTSTEQVIHADRYGEDEPTAVGVPDLGPALGAGWSDLDVMTVGEEWLAAMLDLELAGAAASVAAAGWDGGRYRAWRDGDGVAVVLQTVWDSPDDASEFAEAALDWLEEAGNGATDVLASDDRVAVLWAPDDAALEALRSGLAAG